MKIVDMNTGLVGKEVKSEVNEGKNDGTKKIKLSDGTIVESNNTQQFITD